MEWTFEVVAQFTEITEGPAWDGTGLIFTNIPNNRIMRYGPASGDVTEYRGGTNQANGLMFDNAGRLYGCEGGGRRIVRYEPNGETTVLCDRFKGKRFNSPNDLTIDAQGRVWFTDPRYGPHRADMELNHESVYRLDPQEDGPWNVTRMTFDTTCPNGLLVSPDCRTLYVAESKYGVGEKRDLRAYPIQVDGSLGKAQVLHNFYPHRGIDGMCFDAAGNIVATAGWGQSGPGGMIYVFAPNGRVLATHPTPAQQPTNCTFGDADLCTLYVTSIEGLVMRARTDLQGRMPADS